ncbi:MAG: carboxypeptidase-like regulatory domain-containing protein, partial [Bacteroidota bacterium]
MADVVGDKWENMEGLPFNSDEYSVAHPTLSQDGNRLFFSSDMPGGFGGMDLYMSEQENGSWGPPINLGPQVNTEGNELFPYYYSEKLYFSSDGLIGLGGLDIYYMEDKGNNEWGAIENVGFPLNTISDDFGIIFNEEGTCGFLSSDRTGGAGRDDIYSFKKVASPIEIFVYDEATGEPLEEAVIENSCGGSLTTNEKGKAFVDMKMNICCTFTATKELYEDNAVEGCTKDIKLGERVIVEIPLSRQLEFDIEGIVFDQRTGLPLEGAKVTLTNDCEEEPQELFTDATGRYYFKLSKDCCYTVKGEMETYLADVQDNQCTRDLTESTTLQTNLNLQPTIAGDPGLVDNTTNLLSRRIGSIVHQSRIA